MVNVREKVEELRKERESLNSRIDKIDKEIRNTYKLCEHKFVIYNISYTDTDYICTKCGYIK